MNICPCCGNKITGEPKFCPECGFKLINNAGQINVRPSTNELYKLVLAGCGYCSPRVIADLLIDTFGYTNNRALKLVEFAPVEIAKNLTAEQVRYCAQIFAEYGAEVDILTSDNFYASISPDNTARSIFNRDGTLVPQVKLSLMALSASNRVTVYKRVNDRALLERPYKTSFNPVQPEHVRRFRPTSNSPFGFRPSMHVEENPSLARKRLRDAKKREENK